jgi:hypothetical protein
LTERKKIGVKLGSGKMTECTCAGLNAGKTAIAGNGG